MSTNIGGEQKGARLLEGCKGGVRLVKMVGGRGGEGGGVRVRGWGPQKELGGGREFQGCRLVGGKLTEDREQQGWG